MRMKRNIPVSGRNDTITDCTSQPTHLLQESDALYCISVHPAGTRFVQRSDAARAFQLSDNQLQENQLPLYCNLTQPTHMKEQTLQSKALQST